MSSWNRVGSRQKNSFPKPAKSIKTRDAPLSGNSRDFPIIAGDMRMHYDEIFARDQKIPRSKCNKKSGIGRDKLSRKNLFHFSVDLQELFSFVTTLTEITEAHGEQHFQSLAETS